ncbi:hypothetical protein [Minwuia sp.]|uniref:hypothetical protein n=1 Tax=Minwuia sp. TaxID=2493630 RepID=UPI003A8EC1D6
MMTTYVRNLLGGVAIAAALSATSATADEYRVVLPDHYDGDLAELTAELGSFFNGKIGPGEAFTVFDGTSNKRIARIDVPDEERFQYPRARLRAFAGEIGKVGRFLTALGNGDKGVPGRLDLLSVLRGIGDNRVDRDGQMHVLVLGRPVQYTRDPAWSMIGEKGRLQIPSDAALVSDATRTPYSVSARKDALAGVNVHVCGVGGWKLSRLDDLSLRHVWGTWIAAQGGAMVTWAHDLAVCFERFRSGVSEAISVAEPDLTLPPAMLRPVWNESERLEGKERPVPESFNIFFKKDHPSVRGLIVFTGVEYDPAHYPSRYDHAWCYFTSAAGRDGAQVRVNVGKKVFAALPTWHKVTDRALKAAGVSRDDFVRARSVCQFPVDGS